MSVHGCREQQIQNASRAREVLWWLQLFSFMPYTRLFSLLHCYFIVSLFIHCIWHNVVQMVTLLTLIDLSVGSRSVWDDLKSDETILVNNYFHYYLRTQQESRKQNYQSDSFGAFLWHSKKSVSNQPSFSQVRSPLGLPDMNVLLLFFYM